MRNMYSAYRDYPPFGLSPNVFLFAEIPVQKACESLAVTDLVMNVTEKPSNINTFFKNPTWLDTIFVL